MLNMEDPDKKLFTLKSSLLLHSNLLLHLPMILLSPFILQLSEIVAIGEAINEVNDCNLSSVRQNGIERMLANNTASDIYIASCKVYAAEFAKSNGRTTDLTDIYFNQLASVKSIWAARAAKAVATYQISENLFGNTLMAFFNGTLKGKKRSEQNVFFEIMYFLYFFPLYLILATYFTLLQVLPSCGLAAVFVRLHLLIVALIEVAYIAPVGVIGLLFRCCLDPSVLEEKSGYTAIISDEPEYVEIQVVKPKADMKVGLRFGSDRDGNLMVSNIKHNSLASASGVRIGDMVKTINNVDVQNSSPRDAAATLLGAAGVILLKVSHSHRTAEYDESTV